MYQLQTLPFTKKKFHWKSNTFVTQRISLRNLVKEIIYCLRPFFQDKNRVSTIFVRKKIALFVYIIALVSHVLETPLWK